MHGWYGVKCNPYGLDHYGRDISYEHRVYMWSKLIVLFCFELDDSGYQTFICYYIAFHRTIISKARQGGHGEFDTYGTFFAVSEHCQFHSLAYAIE